MDYKINLIDFNNEVNNKLMMETDEMSASNLSELHMHKLLYIQYGLLYKEFKKELFKCNFEAWKYGLVEINYRNNKDDKGLLNETFKAKLSKKEYKYLLDLTRRTAKFSPWVLVDFTHCTNALFENYDEHKKHSKILLEEIKKSFFKNKYIMLFFINTSLFNWKSFEKEQVIKPFCEIYKKQSDLWISSNQYFNQYKHISRSKVNNNYLFYIGLEKQCEKICIKYEGKVELLINNYLRDFKTKPITNFIYTKIKVNNKNSGKVKKDTMYFTRNNYSRWLFCYE